MKLEVQKMNIDSVKENLDIVEKYKAYYTPKDDDNQVR